MVTAASASAVASPVIYAMRLGVPLTQARGVILVIAAQPFATIFVMLFI